MIGLMFLSGIAVWVAIANFLSKRTPSWLGIRQFPKSARYVSLIILLLLPISDDLIGRWQFNRLCEREAMVWLSPDWENVKGAKLIANQSTDLGGYLIRIIESSDTYVNVDTGEPFLKYKTFYTNGGILFDRFGLKLSAASTHCSLPDGQHKQVSISQLLAQGASK